MYQLKLDPHSFVALFMHFMYVGRTAYTDYGQEKWMRQHAGDSCEYLSSLFGATAKLVFWVVVCFSVGFSCAYSLIAAGTHFYFTGTFDGFAEASGNGFFIAAAVLGTLINGLAVLLGCIVAMWFAVGWVGTAIGFLLRKSKSGIPEAFDKGYDLVMTKFDKVCVKIDYSEFKK